MSNNQFRDNLYGNQLDPLNVLTKRMGEIDSILSTEGNGNGDMIKSIYDTNNDGKVDYAENADNVAWTGVTGKPNFATVATSGDYNDLANKPATSANVYVIELSRWGIVQGLPTKTGVPAVYQTADYTKANTNITGINNALSWAYSNGYNYVVFPRGSYSVCYNPNNIITTKPNMTIDFNFSTFKVMYDSDVRQPYDNSNNATYLFSGDIIHVTTQETHIVNLVLIGDRVDRSWVHDNDNGNDPGTNGVKFSAGSNRSSIRNCNISSFMGDAIALYYSPYTNMPGFTIEAGSLSSTGVPVTGSTSVSVRSTSFMAIPTGLTAFSMIGLGGNPQTTIPSKTYNVYFYDGSGNFIYASQKVRTRDTVQIPKNATQLKLSWEGYLNGATVDLMGGSSVSTTPYWALLIQNGVADDIIVEYNEIHRNHRGGLFLGTNNALIHKNYFHDTGMEGATDIDGLPCFWSSTRYCIDSEDNVGQNCRIIDNVFANSRQAVLLRGNYVEVTGNEFRHNTTGLLLYRQDNATVNHNFFYDSQFSNFNFDVYDRNWLITSNTFDGSTVSFGGSGTISVFDNNSFKNLSSFTSGVQILSYKHNVFNNSTHNISDKNTVIDGNMFINGAYIQATSVPYTPPTITNCTFINSYISMNASKNVSVSNSKFVNSGFLYNVNCQNFTATNCVFNNPTQPVVRAYTSNPTSIGNVQTYTLDLESCTINLGTPNNIFKTSTSYYVGDIVIPSTPNGYYYQCIVGGNSGTTAPTWSTTVGASITSGTATFQVYQVVSTPVIYGYNWGSLTVNNCTINTYVYSAYANALLAYFGDLYGSLIIKNSVLNAPQTAVSNNASHLTALTIDSFSTLTNFSITGATVTNIGVVGGAGATASRPVNPLVGSYFFDTTLNKPIYYKGSNVWVDATGTSV